MKTAKRSRRSRFETLETKRCLAVTAAVTAGGDLLVEGIADGAVEIVAVSEGAYQVTDNGVVIAGPDVLTGVTDDIRIELDDAAGGAVNTVTLDLGAQEVDAIYAHLGNGDNSFELAGGQASRLVYRGGSGDDSITLAAAIESHAQLTLGAGDNSLEVTGTLGRLTARGGNGDDAVTLAEGSVIDRNVRLLLSDGNNSTTIAGAVDGSLSVDGRDGDDTVAIAATAVIADSFFARLGEGANSVTHDGEVGGDFTVVTANEDDSVTIADSATVGGDTNLALGQQLGGRRCHGHGGGFGLLAGLGRELGFFLRAARR